MAASNSNSIPTLPENGIPSERKTRQGRPGEVSPTQRKTPRKTIRKAAPAPKRAPVPKMTEILFEEPPNPFRTPTPPYVWIDHPEEGEKLLAPAYVIRMGIGGAEAVEIMIDKGSWLPCRLTSGYWWYDWAEIAQGKHTLVVRIRTSQGTWYRTPPRRIIY